jgi:hypothetical protein
VVHEWAAGKPNAPQGGHQLSTDAITAALSPASRTPTLLGNSGRRLVGARHAVAAARHPAHGTPLAGLSRLRQLLGLLRDGEPWQQHRRDDQSFQHGDCPQSLVMRPLLDRANVIARLTLGPFTLQKGPRPSCNRPGQVGEVAESDGLVEPLRPIIVDHPNYSPRFRALRS